MMLAEDWKIAFYDYVIDNRLKCANGTPATLQRTAHREVLCSAITSLKYRA
jgi:hypothetical protein